MTDSVAEKQQSPRQLSIGDKIVDSPVGPGVITHLDSDGFPCVNGALVAVLIRDDGVSFNWTGIPLEDILMQWRKVDEQASVTK